MSKNNLSNCLLISKCNDHIKITEIADLAFKICVQNQVRAQNESRKKFPKLPKTAENAEE